MHLQIQLAEPPRGLSASGQTLGCASALMAQWLISVLVQGIWYELQLFSSVVQCSKQPKDQAFT
jgi:hypothetical protein